MDKIYSVSEIENKSREIFQKNNVIKAYLFGSYAYGKPGNNSDIDMALDTGGRISFLRVCGVMEELSQIFEKKVDLFDFREIEQESDIMKEITKKGILLYEAQR